MGCGATRSSVPVMEGPSSSRKVEDCMTYVYSTLCDVIYCIIVTLSFHVTDRRLSARDEGGFWSHSCHPSERYVDGLF